MKWSILIATAVILAANAGMADAGSTKKKVVKRDSRSNYTAEERRKINLYAIELCRKKYGRTSLHHAEINYQTHRVKCYIY